MKKKMLLVIMFIMALSPIGIIYAVDLPIDINAIGREGEQTTAFTQRIGADLFTEDAQRINEVFARRIEQRQKSYVYLFEDIFYHYMPDMQEQILNAAINFALFDQPLNISSFGTTEAEELLPDWLIALVLAICGIIGIMLAFAIRVRKRRVAANVH